MRTALILNDTAQGDLHLGCRRVMSTLRSALSERNICVKASIPVGVDWKSYPDIEQILNNVDLVIVNGEGTLHNGRKKAESLLNIVDARLINKPYFALVNTIYENNPISWSRYLEKFDLVVARDSISAGEIEKSIGRKTQWLPDFSMCKDEVFEDVGAISKIGFLVSDSVSWSSTKVLFQWASKIRHEGSVVDVYPLSPIFKPEIQLRKYFGKILGEKFLANVWSGFIRKKYGKLSMLTSDEDYLMKLRNSSFHVTGRFHSVCMAIIAGTPFAALSSNTSKIERLISDIGLSEARIITVDDLSLLRASEIKFEFSDDELLRIDEYLKGGRQRFLKFSMPWLGSLMGKHVDLSIKHLIGFFDNKSVALVGNADGVIDPNSEIDTYDIVVRINHGYQLPSDGSRGFKTDVICTSSEKCLSDAIAMSKVCIWMTPKNRMELEKMQSESVFFYPVDNWEALYHKIGSRPSSGMMAIDLMVHLGVKFKVFGFNFYKSKNFNGRGKGFRSPHDFDKESEIVSSYLSDGMIDFQKVYRHSFLDLLAAGISCYFKPFKNWRR